MKPVILWITRTGKPEGTLWREFINQLVSARLSITWLDLKAGVDAEWWKENFPKGIRHVLFHDSDGKWIADTLKSLREVEIPDWGLITTLWVLEQLHASLAKKVLESGIDEVTTVRDQFDELIIRLQLREREKAENYLLKNNLREQVTKDAKNETVIKQREEFLSVCAHDLRSPLGLIQSSLGMLLNSKAPLTDLHMELLTRAKRQAGQAITLVNDLLDVMAFEQGLKPSYRLIKLNQFLSEFYKDYSFQAEQKEIKFHYDNPVKEWRVLIDPDRIRQLLQNLFTNALKFTESGKNIYLNVMPFTGRRKSDPSYPMVVVSVKDEGKGIPQKEMERIFDRFTQIKDYSRAEGRGLGLTVAKQISTLHDGNIWVQSVEGQGSTFFVLFPHVISRTQPEDKKSAKRKSILVVSKQEKERVHHFEILGRWGYEIIYAKDGIEAITNAFHYLPEAILVTQDLGKLNEYEVYEMLRQDPMTGNIPILYAAEAKLTTPADEENIFFDEFVRLPLSREGFQIAVDVGLRKLVERKKKKAA